MAENIIKQTDNIDLRDQMALAGLVDCNPPKQTNQRIPDKSINPFSQAPVAKQPTRPTNPMVRARIIGRSSRCPLVVRRWQRLECSKKNSRAILRLRNGARRMRIEPFSILIFRTADPKVADAKTISKYSRVLRYARIAKPADQPLTAFIKSNGGLNECARRFARRSKD
jgi:hypothetical protein